MVQLPKVAFPEPLEPELVRYQFLDYRLCLHHEPLRLLELERLADTAASYMSVFSTDPNLRQLAMNRLRYLFNLVSFFIY